MARELVKVTDLVKQIAENRTQKSANAKDEVEVMRAMLNDPDYKVDVWSRKGIVGQVCPRESATQIAANVIRDTTKMSMNEATELASRYEYSKQDAQNAINISKEFVLGYLETGRKLPLGARKESNSVLELRQKEEKLSTFPAPSGVDANGEKIYANKSNGVIPAHKVVKASGSCPAWVKSGLTKQ